MRALRRAALTLLLTGLAAVILRLRGGGLIPPQSGGWRELRGEDFR